MARTLAILGIVLMAVTMLVFGREIERALQARCVAIVPLELSKETASEVVTPERGRGCQVAVEIRLRSNSVEEAGGRNTIRYNFPIACTALDGEGCEAMRIQAAARWDDATRLVRREESDASGGRAHVQHNLPKFQDPPSGKLQVRATLMPDAEFGASVESAELKVYDNVDRPANAIVVASVALLAGPVVMIVGVVLGVAGWVRARRAEADMPPPSPPEAEGAGP